MTNLQLKTRIAQIVGLAGSSDDSAEEWQLIQDVVNEAILDINLRTRINMRAVTLNLTSGSDEYEFGSAILQIHNLFRGTGELEESMPGDIGRYIDMGQTGGAYAIVGYNRIRLSWVPGAGETLEAEYTPAPVALSADGDDPSTSTKGNIPIQFHQAIINYACWKLADIAGDQGSARGDKYRQWYEGKDGGEDMSSDLGKIRRLINARLRSGSSKRRRPRAASGLLGDAYPDAWVG